MKLTRYLLLFFILTSQLLSAQTNTAPAPAATSTAPIAPETSSSSGMSQVLVLIRAAGTTGWVQIAVSLFGGACAVGCFLRLRSKNIVPAGLSKRARELWAAGDFE